MSLCYTEFTQLLQVGQRIMDCIELEFNDIILLYKRNDFERKRFVGLYI